MDIEGAEGNSATNIRAFCENLLGCSNGATHDRTPSSENRCDRSAGTCSYSPTGFGFGMMTDHGSTTASGIHWDYPWLFPRVLFPRVPTMIADRAASTSLRLDRCWRSMGTSTAPTAPGPGMIPDQVASPWPRFYSRCWGGTLAATGPSAETSAALTSSGSGMIPDQVRSAGTSAAPTGSGTGMIPDQAASCPWPRLDSCCRSVGSGDLLGGSHGAQHDHRRSGEHLAAAGHGADAYWKNSELLHHFSGDGHILTDKLVTVAGLRSSSGSGDPLVLISETAVQSVWRENCAEVFKRVVGKLRQPRRRLYVALDLEFVAGAFTNVRCRPICWNTWYDHLRTFVNGGEMLQVGLALAFDLNLDHQLHGEAQAPSSVIALEINLRFDVNAREYNDASITFLEDQGHCLAEYRDRGITMKQLLNGLVRHIPFGDDSVTWVTFHGDRDFGFLLRLLHPGGRAALPSDRATFMRQVRRQFPVFYDVRVLGQLEKEGFTGSLTALAAHLGVRRIGGEHHAGSDALLTLSCFKEIHHRNEHKLHRLHSRQCLLSGMEEFDMGIKCARHIDDASVITVEVRGHNFNEEARLIDELVTSNFKTVGIDVQLPQLGWGIPSYAADPQQDYDLMKSSLKGIDTFQVTIGFMNAEGMLAYGRVWKFHLSSRVDPAVTGGNNAYVRPGQLAWLMVSCGATHNPNVTWVTYQGSHGIACLIKSFVAAEDLPSDWRSYIKHQRGVFPGLYDVGLIAQGCPEIGKQPLGIMLAPQALLVLRCYKRLAESSCFPHIAEAVRGQLMASQSCFWY